MSIYVPAIDTEDAENMLANGEWYMSEMAAGATADQFTERAKEENLPGPFKVFKIEFKEQP